MSTCRRTPFPPLSRVCGVGRWIRRNVNSTLEGIQGMSNVDCRMSNPEMTEYQILGAPGALGVAVGCIIYRL